MRSRWVLHMVALAIAAVGIFVVAPAHAESYEEEEAAADARSRVDDATLLVRLMKRDHKLAYLMSRARGVFLIPHYGKGGVILAGGGGPGMLFVHRHGQWYGPVFYTVGGFSIGVQAGAAGGSIAMLLMNNKTVDAFVDHTSRWSLDADAGITLVTYGANTQSSSSYPDVVMWSSLEGLYGGIALGADNITVNGDSNRGYYHRDLTPREILAGTMRLSHNQRVHEMLERHVYYRVPPRRVAKTVAKAK